MSSVSPILLAIGSVQLAGGLLLLVTRTLRRRGRLPLEGIVVDNEPYESSEDGTYYRAIFEYTTPQGERRRLKHELGLPKGLPVDGSERRTVWHHPVLPERSYVESKLSLKVPLPVLLAVPVVLIVTGLLLR